jgi:hypothetical protein
METSPALTGARVTDMNGNMNKRFPALAAVVVALGLVAWQLSQRPDSVRGPFAPGTSTEKDHSLDRGEPGRKGDSEAPATNERTRPSQAPPDRVYPKPKPEIPVAEAIKGKPGFVFSPFNNKVVDVRDIPTGTLVADPTYPLEEKKFFRVPEQAPDPKEEVPGGN